MFLNAKWIRPAVEFCDIVPDFFKDFSLEKPVKNASLTITGLGTYEAVLNGKRISDFVLAPGWTSYQYRLQVQTYDITDYLQTENQLSVLLGKGWYRSPMMCWENDTVQTDLMKNPAGLIAELHLIYTDGSEEIISTDESWSVRESALRFSEIYDGEIYDATFVPTKNEAVVCFEGPSNTLIPQQGPAILEQEHLLPAAFFTTPAGETVVDFGQEITGFLEINVTASAGDIVDVSFAEVMDKDGNFYTENYRSAKCQYHYICCDGAQSFKTKLSFYGFRYLRINEFPGGIENARPENFTAIVVHSDLKRTGHLRCSDPLLNQLFSNIIWGQKGNFLDVPTDCPQRNERCGWTGDAEVFVRTACLNYDVEQFFTKWLADLAADQMENGQIGHVIPSIIEEKTPAKSSAAWGDAATICPWEIYLAYGNPAILETQFDSMCKWISYITTTTTTPYLWTGGTHFGDWLGLDAPSGSYKGSSNEDLIASGYYAYSTGLVIKAGKVLGKDVSEYEALYEKIVTAFRAAYPEYHTQTEYAVAIYFGLAEDLQAAADQLAEKVKSCGIKLETGFVGTPYLLHALSSYGYTELAYSLLLRTEYPSWLYPVTKGATTIWEHWDGIMEDGGFWSADMNSFNHYAYGSVADWIYGVAAGITPVAEAPGYEKVRIAPTPDGRLDWLEASVDTRHGLVSSRWTKIQSTGGKHISNGNGFWRYEITTPVEAEIVIAGENKTVQPGSYVFYSEL